MSFLRLSLLLACFIHAEASGTAGTRRPRVNMATGQERLISPVELQTFCMAGAKESNVEMSERLTPQPRLHSGSFFPSHQAPPPPAPLKQRRWALGGGLGGFSVSSIMSHLLTHFYTLTG